MLLCKISQMRRLRIGNCANWAGREGVRAVHVSPGTLCSPPLGAGRNGGFSHAVAAGRPMNRGVLGICREQRRSRCCPAGFRAVTSLEGFRGLCAAGVRVLCPSHHLLECVPIHCWRLSVSRPGSDVKRAKNFARAIRIGMLFGRARSRPDSVGRGRHSAGWSERHTFQRKGSCGY